MMRLKSDQEIQRRLEAEYAACNADPTLKENEFLQGYIKTLELCKGASANFIEGIAEALQFVTEKDKR